jgi:hypothetical protein
MSGSISSNPNSVAFDPTALYGQVNQVQQEAAKSITQALTTLGVVIAGTTADSSGKLKLQAPSALMTSVSDLTLRIGLLQEALSNLQNEVTKLQITNRMNDQNKQAQLQLDKINQQISDAKAAADKQQQANQKSGIFGAIAHFFGAIFDFITAVVNIVEAIPLAIGGDVVGAAALLVSAGALVGAGVCEAILGADSLDQAITGQDHGFLSADAKDALQKTSMALSIVAGAAALISGIGVISYGLKQAFNAAEDAMIQVGTKAAAELAEEGGGQLAVDVTEDAVKPAFKDVAEAAFKGAKEGLKEVWKDSSEAVEESTVQLSEEGTQDAVTAAKEAFKDAAGQTIKDLKATLKTTEVLNTIGGAGPQVINFAGTMATNPLLSDAASLQQDAEMDAAKAKQLEAVVDRLKKQIQVLEKQLQQLMQSSMQSVSAVFNAATKSSDAVGQLIQVSI